MKALCWIITDGSAGMENQALGLGQALGYKTVIKRVYLRKFWVLFSPYLKFGKKCCLKKTSDSLKEPFPDLIIACGRRSILPSLYVKEKSQGKTRLIYLQDPKISAKNFDVVVCPQHDTVKGDNVITMIGAPHHVTPERLERASLEFEALFSPYKQPRYGVLLGGPNRVYSLDLAAAQNLAKNLDSLQKNKQVSLIITPSRRTPVEVLDFFINYFKENKNVYVWDRTGSNPYFGLLALSDVILLTCDSVSMASEVCATKAPAYFLKLPGGSKKFEDFQKSVVDLGRIRWFEKNADPFDVTPLNLNDQVLSELIKRGYDASSLSKIS